MVQIFILALALLIPTPILSRNNYQKYFGMYLELLMLIYVSGNLIWQPRPPKLYSL